jgi:uncharacterized membrane protein YjgN (DUF898 family)
MNLNKYCGVFICIIYVVVFKAIVQSQPHNSLPIGTLEETIVVWLEGESERFSSHSTDYHQ